MTTVKFRLDNCEAANKAMELFDFRKMGNFKTICYASRDWYVDLYELSKEKYPDDVAADIRGVVSLLGGEFD